MALNTRKRKAIRIAAFTIGVLLLGTVASVRMQQLLLRWRAERLLSDIRGLQLGKSTWADAQKIMTRWGAWGFYEGSCNEKRCTYQIAFRDVSRTFLVMSVPDGSLHAEPQVHNAWVLKAYRILGGQSALIAGRVEVINGVIWGKGYELDLNISDGSYTNEGEYVLATYAETVWKRKDLHDSYKANPTDYRISRGAPCSGCEIIEAQYTPFVDPKFINDVFNFNLDCLTRLIQCRHPAEIAPGMWERADKDKSNPESVKTTVPVNECTMPPEFLGREQENVVIATVFDSQVKQLRKNNWRSAVSFHLDRRLKRADFWKIGDLRWVNTSAYDRRIWEAGRPGLFRPGNKVILMFESPNEFSPRGWIGFDLCNVLPATDENLAAVRRGISRDVFP